MTVTTIDRDSLTLLVLPAKHITTAQNHDAYPVDLCGSADEVSDDLETIAELESVDVAELVIAGVEFDDPEQHNTTVTLRTDDLAGVLWLLDGGSLALADTVLVLGHRDRLTAIEVAAAA